MYHLVRIDVILDMDWLSKHHTIVDYYTKEVVIDIVGWKNILLVGERKFMPSY